MCDKCPSNPLGRYGQGRIPAFSQLRKPAVRRALEISNRPGGVVSPGGDRYHVLPANRHEPVVVRWRLSAWRCDSCSGKVTEARPCFHMIAVFLHLGLLVTLASESVLSKVRNQAAFDAAKRNMHVELPKLMRLVAAEVRETRLNPIGREAILTRDLVFGAMTYVESGDCLRETEGALVAAFQAGHINRPYSYSLLSEYLECPTTSMELQRLQLLIAIATAAFTRSGGPDGTGFQRRNYFQYAEDRARWRARKEQEKRLREQERLRTQDTKRGAPSKLLPSPKKVDLPRHRGYIQAIPLIAYETNIILDVHVRAVDPTESEDRDDDTDPINLEDGLRGEAPYFLALFERVRPYLPYLKDARADKGFQKMLHHWWGYCWNISVHIEPKSNFKPGARSSMSGKVRKAATRAYDAWMEHRKASEDEYHKRSQQEGVMNGVKVEVGGGVRTRTPTSQLNEVRLKWMVYSLKQVLYLMHAHDWKPDFAAASAILGPGDLVPLEELAAKFLQKSAADIIEWQSKNPLRSQRQVQLPMGAM
jgi:hypothetical protein